MIAYMKEGYVMDKMIALIRKMNGSANIVNFYLIKDNTRCIRGQFECENGHCVDDKLVCNKNDDCGDGSDEFDCQGIDCTYKASQCDNKQCIWLQYRCDGTFDCDDWSDERNCITIYNLKAMDDFSIH
ncbi:Basement membrane-specific heparan sulfate proteoglycan core protein [Thelohanellus kitauei]|uniref:Basement membrane-specific heparan sulfate proteoglycan core protein n=1 Tax=Thelohanellus kitauei TaxID=669202 RepID=A0A0C2MLB2_THEKT|nr:Basement membrane-specific heparan sulfate proteoglycan core protein [Thelohanellus kitauei]